MSDLLEKAHKLGNYLSKVRGGICAFGTIYEDGVESERTGGACHWALNSFNRGRPKYLVDAIYPVDDRGISDELRKDYIKLHMELPIFKGAFYDQPVEDMLKQGYSIFNTDIDRNVISMLLMSLRMAYERPEMLLVYDKLVKIGVKRELAYVYCHLFILSKNHQDVLVRKTVPESFHIGLHASYLDKKGIQYFLKGEIQKKSILFSNSPGYNSICKIFGHKEGIDLVYKRLGKDLLPFQLKREEIKRQYLFYKPKAVFVMNKKEDEYKLTKEFADFLNNYIGEDNE